MRTDFGRELREQLSPNAMEQIQRHCENAAAIIRKYRLQGEEIDAQLFTDVATAIGNLMRESRS